MVSTLEIITDEVAAECDRDTVGLWEVCAAVRRSGTDPATREQVMSVCSQLVARSEIRCCQFDRDADAFVVWFGTPEKMLERIRAGYDALGGHISLGDVVWFSSERYLKELVKPAVKWPDATQTI